MGREVTRRRTVMGMGTVLVSGSLAGCTGGDGGSGGGRDVEMTDDLVFGTPELNVDVGETVTWSNVGSVEHTVTAYENRIPEDAAYFASGGYDSEQAARDSFPDEGAIPGGESFEHTFQIEGTYEYFCIPHEGSGMTGTIEVSESGPQL